MTVSAVDNGTYAQRGDSLRHWRWVLKVGLEVGGKSWLFFFFDLLCKSTVHRLTILALPKSCLGTER